MKNGFGILLLTLMMIRVMLRLKKNWIQMKQIFRQ